MKNNIILIVVILFLLVFCSNFQKTSENRRVESITFEQRLEVLKYEKRLVCQIYEYCDASIRYGALYSNPQRAVTNCQITLKELSDLKTPEAIDFKTKSSLNDAKDIFIEKTKNYIKDAKKEASGKKTRINLAPLFEPRNCDAYGYLDEVNKDNDLYKVMYDKNEKRYDYVNCNNLSVDDIETLLIQYDSNSKN